MVLRIGLAGTGTWARLIQAPALAHHPQIELVGVWGRNMGATQLLAEEFATCAFDSFEALLAEADAMAFAVPPGVQAQLATIAMARGRHVLLEKPIADSPPGAAEVIAAQARADVAAVVCLPRFFDEALMVWVEGSTGADAAEVEWASDALLASSPFAAAWRAEAGALLDVGPHIVPMLEHVLGPVVQGNANNHSDGMELEFTHDTGATSHVHVSLTVPGDHVERYRFRRDGAWRERRAHVDFPTAYQRLLDTFLELAASGEPIPQSPWGLRRSARVLEMLDALAASGRWVATDGDD